MVDWVTGPVSAEIRIHSPCLDHWYLLEEQDTYPSPGSSWKRFFRNQEGLKQTMVEKELEQSMIGAEAVILAVPHKQYLDLNPDDMVKWAGGPIAIIDAFGILTDDKIRRYFELGCEVKALGRGHLASLKREVREKQDR